MSHFVSAFRHTLNLSSSLVNTDLSTLFSTLLSFHISFYPPYFINNLLK